MDGLTVMGRNGDSENCPTCGLPKDLARVLQDQSVIIPRDAAVFELIAKWNNAPSNTAPGAYRPDAEIHVARDPDHATPEVRAAAEKAARHAKEDADAIKRKRDLEAEDA